MNNILVNAHSIMRWLVLIFLVYAIVNAFLGTNSYSKKDKMVNLFAMVMLHIQLVIGGILFMTSGKVAFIEGWIKNEQLRFFNLEHLFGMIIAITIVTVGRRIAEKQTEATDKHKKIRFWYLAGLIVIIAFIPWPFREVLGGRWF